MLEKFLAEEEDVAVVREAVEAVDENESFSFTGIVGEESLEAL